ncbi:urease accessory protein UreD [Lactiplantibacillus plantarum]|uniref:urease accessory protein UreD n=3 Tax=Bacillati TaxID=1783272 RepID=UPI0005FB6C97|nr:urease accessory protein UreD [Lactiplantibacillus plantarum]MCG0573023.1 Urease accessory protein UreD [Lactiplantibacillus plantarum]MCG0810910.1 Urease accessory protein UreD [Lactiplantibacillus plantarum]MDN5583896.1 urease accessory protein UreD [Lactobacillus sp.]
MSEQFEGEIKMSFVERNGRTIAQDTYHRGNSRISAEIPTTGYIPYYFLISTGGGYVEGEHYRQEISLADNTHAILTTQTPNYIYKCENRKVTRQFNDVTVGKDAVLECYLDETIPYRHACYQQDTEIKMAKGSKLILTDGLTSGWSPDDQPFQYRQVGVKTRIIVDDHLAYNDYLLVNPEDEEMFELGFFEGHMAFNSVVLIDPAIDGQIVNELRDYMKTISTSSRFGMSLLESDGLVFRIMGQSAHENRKVMWAFINYYREQIEHYDPINLRKSEHLEA